MIRKLDIGNFGSFKDFVWSKKVRDKGNNVGQFKKLNILYGKNYSGKTTLSRIFRAIETKSLPERYEEPNFLLETDEGKVSNSSLDQSRLNVRVYNKDFVDSQLSFLRDCEKQITPFAILGGENTAAETRIKEIDQLLGSVESKKGVRYDLEMKVEEISHVARRMRTVEKDLMDKMTAKATKPPNGIKHNTNYKDPNYNTPKLEADIKVVLESDKSDLTSVEIEQLTAVLKETALPDIDKTFEFKSKLAELLANANVLITKKIAPTQAIQDLLNDSLLQSWVKTGMPLHRNKRSSCGFCGQPLPDDIWNRLDNHFSKESGDLERGLTDLLDEIRNEVSVIDGILSIDKELFYATLRPEFEILSSSFSAEKQTYKMLLAEIQSKVAKRQTEIFTVLEGITVTSNASQIDALLLKVNELVAKNDKRSNSLETEQKLARAKLRQDEVNKFIDQIGYLAEKKKIEEFIPILATLESERSGLAENLRFLEEELVLQNSKLRDERKGADRVNDFLNGFFGHNGLRLSALEVSGTSTYKFEIQRGGKPAYNLSEGECSLVAFCYFVAKLEDSETAGKDVIIYIDDPISSLDNNHIFFLFSLIESKIARPMINPGQPPIYRYKQLFVSTHNLEFLKYLKRLSRPSQDHEHFLVSESNNISSLQLMPEYLRRYITELNHLFGEIYNCVDPSKAEENHSSYYSFGNNLRKFLEAFLFFKFPSTVNESKDYDDRIKMFFGSEPISEILVQRLTNEFSHLGEFPDRGVVPIDHAEIAKLSKFVLRRIKENDSTQFECFLQSIGKVEPNFA